MWHAATPGIVCMARNGTLDAWLIYPMTHQRVLVVEDDADLRTSVTQLLSAEGMDVVEAGSGKEALATLLSNAFDLVVTDVMMPPPLGVEVAALARTAGDGVPILVMTGLREKWVDDAVGQLQRADLLHKPFSADELLAHVHALLTRKEVEEATASERQIAFARDVSSDTHVFPPAIVPILRDRFAEDIPCIGSIDDHVLAELLSVVFFAGLVAEEGEHKPVRVVFVGSASSIPETEGSPLYRWSTLRFRVGRPFSVGELVKLATATGSERVFTQIRFDGDELVLTGLAREGINVEGDAFLKVVVPQPGALSIRVGRRHLLEYEHGHVHSPSGDVVFSQGPVRRSLEVVAAESGVDNAVDAYLDAVRALVGEMTGHGSGGIMVFTPDAQSVLPSDAPYLTYPEVSLAAIIGRLHTQVDHVLRVTFFAELERTVEELGALSALDGAVVFDRSLAVEGFGVILPMRSEEPLVILEARDAEAHDVRPFDISTRGARHRAAATYAMNHAGTVVFVASEDGPVGCFFRAPGWQHVVLWPFHAMDARHSQRMTAFIPRL